MNLSYEERVRQASEIERLQQDIANEVTAEFFERHPDWKQRYGLPGWKHGVDDACFHMRFLAGSIVAGSPAHFLNYLRWTAHMLNARGMAPKFLIENVLQIETSLKSRLSESGATLVTQYVQEAIHGFQETLSKPTSDPGEEGGLHLTCQIYTQAVLNGERTAAANIILETLSAGTPPHDIYTEVLQNALYAVGRSWEANEITVAQEHLATAITQYVISLLYAKLPSAGQYRGNAVIAGSKGDLHQLGPMMLADVLELDGWKTRFLGTDMPQQDIAKAVEAHEAQVLGISATMLFSIPRVREIIELCRASKRTQPLYVIVGGQAFRHAPDMVKEVGADAFAEDLKKACHLLREVSSTQLLGVG